MRVPDVKKKAAKISKDNKVEIAVVAKIKGMGTIFGTQEVTLP